MKISTLFLAVVLFAANLAYSQDSTSVTPCQQKFVDAKFVALSAVFVGASFYEMERADLSPAVKYPLYGLMLGVDAWSIKETLKERKKGNKMWWVGLAACTVLKVGVGLLLPQDNPVPPLQIKF